MLVFLQESHRPLNLFQIPECVFSLIELVVFWASANAIIIAKGLKYLFKIEHKFIYCNIKKVKKFQISASGYKP